MNTLKEISLQNQQDFWARLYLYTGNSIMKTCGRRGEAIIRRAVRSMAEDRGKALRDAYLEQGILTNLETLYAAQVNCSADPRVRMEVLREEEDIRIWEVYTCPMADLWLDQDAGFLGNLYCEENQHGLVRGFTDGKGQMNLTKKLTCHRTNGCRADNYCRFSSYYRAANVGGRQRRESFTGEGMQKTAVPAKSLPEMQDSCKEKCMRLLHYLTEAARQEAGSEGICAVAAGLRELVQPTAKQLLHDADATLSKDLSRFAAENLPLELEGGETAWGRWGGQAYQLFQVNFAGPLKKELGLSS